MVGEGSPAASLRRFAYWLITGGEGGLPVACACNLGQCPVHAPCGHEWAQTKPGDCEATYVCPACEGARCSGAKYGVGDRVAFTGDGGGTGTVISVRQMDNGDAAYRVTWDGGIGSDIELGEDELNVE